ncbi:hypothetical protein [Streptomyces spiramenti]|uniref:Antitoxin n=1 Tax=Streptomyces spiramenti TaxID=2720606 RepID=A0ABX1AMK2_9ACTN|nr:hypothetical protein [Streptomyces spiramenti]NJP66300.1 hypothetical protein [Streptomyces spiramenti]
MPSFFDRAKEQAQGAIKQGKDKFDEVQTQRAGNDALRKLGAAYYRKERGNGSDEEVKRALDAVARHVQEHGDDSLK